MTKLFKVSFLTLIMFISATIAHAQYVVINGNNVCIRSSATLNANNKIGHENRGATFAYLGTYGSFYCINYHGQYGYVHKSYSYTTSGYSAPRSQTLVYVKGYNVRIRTAPSLHGGIVGSANWGDYFVYLGYTNGWYKIKYGGKTRYISAQFAST